jgi:hypothetical protein
MLHVMGFVHPAPYIHSQFIAMGGGTNEFHFTRLDFAIGPVETEAKIISTDIDPFRGIRPPERASGITAVNGIDVVIHAPVETIVIVLKVTGGESSHQGVDSFRAMVAVLITQKEQIRRGGHQQSAAVGHK